LVVLLVGLCVGVRDSHRSFDLEVPQLRVTALCIGDASGRDDDGDGDHDDEVEDDEFSDAEHGLSFCSGFHYNP